MWKWVRELDRILRGEVTRLPALRTGQLDIDARGLAVVLVALGVLYGFCMGWFALFNRDRPEFQQLVASMVKVPALFFLTLAVTFPSLYVFNALVGSRLTAPSLLRLLLAALGVTLAVLASFGPIVAFFSLTTTSYPFMQLLNVLLFAVAGALGLTFLLQTLHRLTIAGPAPPMAEASEIADPGPAGALQRAEGHILGRNVKPVFYCWVVVFGLVGAQMSWVLRPFIGHPDLEFQWFRQRQSHFFEAVWQTWRQLFS
jgi:hypothetical protein